jgi:hypothetical protein
MPFFLSHPITGGFRFVRRHEARAPEKTTGASISTERSAPPPDPHARSGVVIRRGEIVMTFPPHNSPTVVTSGVLFLLS